MYEIIPHLYLSSYRDVQNVPSNFFVINCTKDLPMMKTDLGGTRLLVDDHPTSMNTMTRHMKMIVEYIEYFLKQDENVVVHCYAGQQRSAIIVAGYLVLKKGYMIDEAIEYIKSKKSDAFLDGVHFMDSLKNNVYV